MKNEEKPMGWIAFNTYEDRVKQGYAGKDTWDKVAESVITEHERRKRIAHVDSLVRDTTQKPEWKLPDPPEGEQWHRIDWTQDMLPDGWRPLLATEHTTEGDDISGDGKHWTLHFGSDWELSAGAERSWFQRTTRPLPVKPDPFAAEKGAFAAGKTIQYFSKRSDEWLDCDSCPPSWLPDYEYRVKPEPVLVQLGPDDVKCGDEITTDDGYHRAGITGVNPNGVCITTGYIGWDFLKTRHKINRNDGLGWVPCSKPKQD